MESDADSVLDISNSALPDGLIQARVDTNIVGSHGLLGELSDCVNCFWCPVLESDAMNALVQVDGVFAGYDVLDG